MDDDTYEQLLDEAEADGLLKVIHVAHQPFNSKSWKSIPVGLAIVLASDPVLASGENAIWMARLVVKTGNIVGLMKGGFHWSPKNVHSEASHFDMKVNDPELSQYKQEVSRTFYLSDTRTPVSWTAKLEVAANKQSDLARFKVNDLELDQIEKAEAWNTNGQLICHYCRHDQYNNFNAIYDDLPLEGWWPWPKQNEQAVGIRRTRQVGKSVDAPKVKRGMSKSIEMMYI
ncbi:unnamed protein product [Colletotrichum noveboracense]|uniref:Uncharacterized protein n=1 Tax=Colletotrichum noveboracense TaxID=2664923 RepID=A0A9W4W4H3_9PEZI|nr:hypothetical protein K456DRAFT_1726061 [Colletotrichum gloeosporioides 23]CAI0642658.1 unnamed protein product [Colletotrichum noveboracense]